LGLLPWVWFAKALYCEQIMQLRLRLAAPSPAQGPAKGQALHALSTAARYNNANR